MTQYEQYLLSLAPWEHWTFNSVLDDDLETIYTGVIRSETATTDNSGHGVGVPSLLAENDTNNAIGFNRLSNLTLGEGVTTQREFTITMMFKVDIIENLQVLWNSFYYTVYLNQGVLTLRQSSAPSTNPDVAVIQTAPLIEGETYHIALRVTLNATTGYYDFEIFLNGQLAASTINPTGPVGSVATGYSASLSMYINYIGRPYSNNDAQSLGVGSTSGVTDASIQYFTMFDKILTDYEISKLGYLARFNATPVTLNGSILENYLADEYLVRAHDVVSGDLVYSELVTTGSFSALVPDIEYYVIVSASQGEVWRENSIFGVGDKVYPTDVNQTRFYFECTVAGTTGATEPVWDTALGATTTDNTVQWAVVERLIQPLALAPVRGT